MPVARIVVAPPGPRLVLAGHSIDLGDLNHAGMGLTQLDLGHGYELFTKPLKTVAEGFEPSVSLLKDGKVVGGCDVSEVLEAKLADEAWCIAALDVGIRFPDDSLGRPDLAIFCRAPEPVSLITLVPEAVVEIVSRRSRHKDLVVGPPFYLEMGVKDVLVFDPLGDEIHHFRRDGSARFKPGKTVRLDCGCILEM